MLLVADVGATKTDVAVLASGFDPREFVTRRRFHSADYRSLAAIAREFMVQLDAPVRHACFDVAGPVVDGCAHLTNLPWDVNAQALQRDLGLEDIWVINDLAAVAHAVPLLQADDLHRLNAGTPVAGGAIAVIAPGTGLGEAFLVWDGVAYRGYPSEGGHADFAPTTALQVDLLRYLRQRVEHVSYELVCSGHGIPYLYEFCRDSQVAPESSELAAQLSAAVDRTTVDRRRRHARRGAGPALRGDDGRIRDGPRRGGGQSRAQGACDRWHIYRRRHRAAHPALARGRTLRGGVSKQGSFCRPGLEDSHPCHYGGRRCAHRCRQLWSGTNGWQRESGGRESPATLGCGAPIRRNFPIPACLIVSKDVHISIIRVDFEPPLRWGEPAVNQGAHDEPVLPEPEREGLLFAAIAGVTLYANRHTVTIPLLLRPRISSSWGHGRE